MANNPGHMAKECPAGPDRASSVTTLVTVIRVIVASLVMMTGSTACPPPTPMTVVQRVIGGVQTGTPDICDLFPWWPGCQ